ncbi:transglycosylase domain-containing protein [Streptomyces sp. NPDC057638]|uniref:transglycosylase domain-containing protein n=1 Tax=Streptomyces sp. NPDC057638 TaxID=3346190 RepID=UPI0036B24159
MPVKRFGKDRSGRGRAARFLGISALSGAVLAGIALPAVGAVGLAAKGMASKFDELPSNLKRPPLSQRTTILDAKGDTIASVYYRDRTVVPLTDISPYMRKAIVAIEDSRFYEHGAIDLKGILRALNSNARSGEVTQGASTLTQQYVKNVFVEEAGNDQAKFAEATQQTPGRKIRELKYAIQVEEELGKEKILENYLNITFFGQQAYGVEAASKRYFSKSAKDLKLEEAALLAGLVQSPSVFDPVNSPQAATKRRNIVLQRMAEVGAAPQAEVDRAKATPIQLKVSKPKNGCITAVKGAGFFCDYVRKVFQSDPVFGKTPEERTEIWSRGGLTIKTTLDPKAQDSLQKSVKEHVFKSDKVAAAMTIVEPGTGKIQAMGQSRPYGFGKNESEINYSVDRKRGGSNFGFPVGSTFKPFVAAAALEEGRPVNQSYTSPYRMPYPDRIASCGGKNWRNGGGATVQNELQSEVGPYPLRTAMAKSVNTYFVQMIEDIGLCPVVGMTNKLGLLQGNGAKLPVEPSALTLGSNGMSPLTMASAYAAFANRGTYCTPIAIESITTAEGKALPVPKSRCAKAMSEKTADSISELLKGVVSDQGTGNSAGLDGRDNAGKTGTTDGRRNAWFVGYTPNLSGAVWVGSPTQSVEMFGIRIGGEYKAKVFGGDVPGAIWRDGMNGALEGEDAPSFTKVAIPEATPEKDRSGGEDRDGDRGEGRGENGRGDGDRERGRDRGNGGDGDGGGDGDRGQGDGGGGDGGSGNGGSGNGGSGDGGSGDGGDGGSGNGGDGGGDGDGDGGSQEGGDG